MLGTRTPSPHTAPATGTGAAARRGVVARINAATPPNRDRAVDALRAFAILGVILGHWLVTAFVPSGDGQLAVTSPLASMPAFAPVSWVLQTLAVFFLVGGYTAARGHRAGEAYLPWLKRRMARLLRPVPVLLLAWIPATAALWWAGYEPGTLRSLVKLVLSPLWFLAVYGTLTALTPLITAAWRRLGVWGAAIPVAVTAAIDWARFGVDCPAWLGGATVITGWLVPFYLGVAWANGKLGSRRAAVGLLAGGAAATAGLIMYAGYPASMVGVPGAAISNLNPPTLAAVAFGIAQAGLALLLRRPLARWMERPRAWAGVALANLSAMTVFLWHQTAMMTITVGAALAVGTLPGLHSAPGTPAWVLARLPWLLAFAAALAGFWALAHKFERGRSS
ncbi:acyltransferase family protein [Actinomadura rudentiformis]|uniref:Acyltransferase n=1 Tax=Actinomadura rudentiformis TaxID=359158 RepID=A0A6H9YT26_9ACTN|nr:acyltransferase [Actinomadura rudentiformis]KAB2346505.1 acyltransferase [Actinomadura rudentiformis]